MYWTLNTLNADYIVGPCIYCNLYIYICWTGALYIDGLVFMYPLWTNTREKITFPQTSFAGGKNKPNGPLILAFGSSNKCCIH